MGLFSVKIKGVTNVTQSIKNLFNEVKKDKSTKIEIGEKLLDMTQKTVRSGYSPDADGLKPKRQRPISKAWIKRKDRLSAVNKTSEFYRKGASNLTFTGQLVDSLDYELKSSTNSENFILKATGNRKPYEGLNGKDIKSDVATNDELVTELKKKQFYVFGITSQMKNVVNKIVRLKLLEKLKIFRARK